MAASPVLVDSSFYIQRLRQGQDPMRALALTAAARDLAVCGVVRCEVARGLRERRVLKRFQPTHRKNKLHPNSESTGSKVELRF